MQRPIALVGAASSIGIRPYEDGTPRRLDRAPNALRELNLTARLGARDHGDVTAPPYRDVVRPPARPRNERDMVEYSRSLAARIADARQDGAFIVVLGGDCGILLGSLLALAPAGRVGLAYIDAHADFATPEQSRTGSVASMCLALAVGRGASPLARLREQGEPLVRGDDVVLIGRRDEADAPFYGQHALREHQVLDVSHAALRASGAVPTAATALSRVTRAGMNGFWIHLDADVLDPAVMPAVDSPEPDGLSPDEVVALLRPLVSHPASLGLELTIYDPQLDPAGACAALLVGLLHDALAEGA